MSNLHQRIRTADEREKGVRVCLGSKGEKGEGISVPVGDVGLDPVKHVEGGLVHFQKHAVENLRK